MRAPSDSVGRASETARPGWIVLPRYEAGLAARLTPLSRARGLMHMADTAFNYSAHGRRGYEVLAGLVEQSTCYEFAYGDLEEAAAVFNDLASRA
jgi:hypothetical protein